MVQFISSNPVSDQMNVNAARELSRVQVLNGLMNDRDARRLRANQDKAARGIAEIYADDPAQPAPTQAAPPPATAAPSMPAAPPPAASTPPPAPPSALIQVAPAVAAPQGFEKSARPGWAPEQASAPMAAVPAPVAQSPLVAVTAPKDVHADRLKKAIQVAAQQEGGGAMAMQLANQYSQHQTTQAKAARERADKAHLEVIKAAGDGNYDLAKAINKRFSLGMDDFLNNPTAWQVTRALSASIKDLKLSDDQKLAYMEAGATKYAETRDMGQAGMAGMLAARKVPGKQEKMQLVESADGRYIDPHTGKALLDEKGKPVRVPDRRIHFNPSAGANDETTGARFVNDLEGNLIAVYRNGKTVYVKDQQGNPLKVKAPVEPEQEFIRKMLLGYARSPFVEVPEDQVAHAKELAAKTSRRSASAAPAVPDVPPGLPQGSKQIGTSNGKPVYQSPDGKRYIAE